MLFFFDSLTHFICLFARLENESLKLFKRQYGVEVKECVVNGKAQRGVFAKKDFQVLKKGKNVLVII